MLFALLALAAAPKETTTVPTKRPPDNEVGMTVWKQQCSACHGHDGKGDGPASADVIGGVPLLAVPGDDTLDPAIDTVLAGRGRMPAFSETLERRDVRATLVYIREAMAGRKVPGPDSVESEPDAPAGDAQ